MFKGTSIYEFRRYFQTEADCLQYLHDIKWSAGYQCRKCSNTKCYSGRTKWYLKCSKCNYDESVTSNTIFHKMKIPLLKAFEVMFSLSIRKKGISSLEIARTYELNENTAWLLKRKTQYGMFSSGRTLLKNEVYVDEFAVGGKEKKKQGRSSTSKKTKVVLACEVVVNKKGKRTLGNAYAQVIDNYSAKELKQIFDNKIDSSAKVKTDKWTSYQPIGKQYDIESEKSKGGENFKELNTLTMLFKGWLRGIHHHVSKEHMQNYINEFFFRFNRKAFPNGSFNKLINNLMESKPLFIQLREVNG